MVHDLLLLLAITYGLFLSLERGRDRVEHVQVFYQDLSDDQDASLGQGPRLRYRINGDDLPELPPPGDYGSNFAKRRHAPVLCFAKRAIGLPLDPRFSCKDGVP